MTTRRRPELLSVERKPGLRDLWRDEPICTHLHHLSQSTDIDGVRKPDVDREVESSGDGHELAVNHAFTGVNDLMTVLCRLVEQHLSRLPAEEQHRRWDLWSRIPYGIKGWEIEA